MSPNDPRFLDLARALAAFLTPTTVAGEGELVPLAEAARIAATSVRVLRAAIRTGDLPAYGLQRDRSVRRADLAQWIDERRVRIDGVDDPDIARRVRRLRVVQGAK